MAVNTATTPTPVGDGRVSRAWLRTAVTTLAAAGALHLVAAVDHRDGRELVVAFFLAVALAQVAAAIWLVVEARARATPSTLTLNLATAATVGLLVLYLAAHTTDLFSGVTGPSPHAPGAGHGAAATVAVEGPEPAGWLGSATVTVELVLLFALTALLPRRARRIAVNGILAVGASAWALWLFGLPG